MTTFDDSEPQVIQPPETVWDWYQHAMAATFRGDFSYWQALFAPLPTAEEPEPLAFDEDALQLTAEPSADPLAVRELRWPAAVSAAGASLPRLKWGVLGLLALLGPLAFLLGLVAQAMVNPAQGQGSPWGGALLYAFAAVLMGVVVARLPMPLVAREDIAPTEDVNAVPVVRWTAVILALIFSGLTYLSSAQNFFSPTAALFWAMSMASWAVGLWAQPMRLQLDLQALADKLWTGEVLLRVTRTGWLLLAIMVIGAFFRFGQLDTLPGDMTSDHVEKLIDSYRILTESTFRPIFLANNGGREPLMFYLTAAVSGLVGQVPSHLILKLITATVGWLTIPLVYLLAKEISDEDRVALLAALLFAIAWWPNSISRNGLRFPFAPLFTVLVLLFLLRGLKRNQPGNFVLAGLALGLGVYGYTPSRIVPIVIGLALLVYWLHHFTRANGLQALWRLVVIGVVSVAVAMPLLRYIADYPEFFWFRTVTRIAGDPANPTTSTAVVFLTNLRDSLSMFARTGDAAWLVSPSGQPALDTFTAVLFHLGLGVVVVRYWRQRNWMLLFTLLALPVLLLPSTLALAFPIENPSLHRSGAALPLVFLVVALGAEGLWRATEGLLAGRMGSVAGALLVGLVVLSAANLNRDIVFDRYANQYRVSVQNASGVAQVVRAYATSVGDWETVWVRPYAYWVDTRGVGIYAGNFGWDNVIYEGAGVAFEDTLADPRTKLFILNLRDQESLAELRALYPDGLIRLVPDEYPPHGFYTYLVPARSQSEVDAFLNARIPIDDVDQP